MSRALLVSACLLLSINLVCATMTELEAKIVDVKTPICVYFLSDKDDDSYESWDRWFREEAEQRRDVHFVELDFRYMEAFNNMSTKLNRQTIFTLPNAVYIYNDVQYIFNREYTQHGVKRWLDDASLGYQHPILLSSNPREIDSYVARFNGSVEIVSKRPLYWKSMKKITSIGFTFSEYDVTPMFFVRSLFGGRHLFHSAKHVFHGLVDTIIPFSAFERYDVQELINHYAVYEVHIVQEGNLSAWWYDFANLYPYTLFVHYQPHESDLPAPSVNVFNRTVEYQINSTDIEIIRWYHDVVHARETPTFRKSTPAETTHPTVVDITGDNMWSTLHAHEDIFIALYSKQRPCGNVIGDMSERFMNTSAVYGRFDMEANDHEALASGAKPGFIVYYQNGVRKNVIRCI